jgi:epothilone synthetase B
MTALTGHPDPAAAAGAKRDLLLRLVRRGGSRPSPQREQETRNLPAISIDPDRRNDPFPLTEIQQAYWIGRSAVFDFGDVSIHAYVEVEGDDIDLARLERSWQQLVDRHDMLRAVVLPDGQQRILPTVPPYRLKVTDLRGHDKGQVTRVLAATREELSHQVVSAEEWPGFDVRAILLDGGRTRAYLSVDMLHVDGGSVMILLEEWMRLYHDSVAELPALELSFRDYVLGEIAQRDSEQYRRSIAYWQDRVQTLPPPPALPVKPVARNPAFRHRFHRRSTTLPAEVWQRLKERATRAGLTSSGVLLSAYADVLACWSKDDAFTVNVTLFNRLPMHPQVNRILGDFTSMVLVEMPAAVGQPFAERAATVQRQLWEGLEHRTVSGIRVLRDLARLRPAADGPLMPVVFSMLDLTAQGFQPPLTPLRTLGEVVYSITQTPQVWLDHQVWEEDGAIVLIWDSVEDLFPPGLLDDMFDAYLRFLRKLADDEAAWQRRGRSEHVPPEQMARRAAVNATDAAIADDTLVGLFLRQAAERPGSPAVITSVRTLTYEQILRQARRLGRTLRSGGVTPGSLVAVVMDKGWEQVAAVLGIQLAGAAYLPVDPCLPAERRAYLLGHGEVRIAMTQPWLDSSLGWPPHISRLCVAEDAFADNNGGSDGPLTPPLGPGDLSHVIYTSGSTGQPKGVMIEHRSVVNRITDVNRRLEIGPRDRVLALTALHHDLSVYDIFGVLAAGAAMVIPDADRVRDPGHWAGLMATGEVTIWNSVPAFLQMLVEYIEARTERPELLPRFLRAVVLAGDWIPVTLPERLRRLAPQAQFIASGGPTETTIWDIWNPVQDVDPDWLSIPYGRPMDNTRYHVLNQLLEPRPVWVPGQLCIAGAGLARGYWRDDDKTRERFVTYPDTSERVYLSGDIGRYLPDGSIEFLGRDDSQVKIGGHRIELGEVEAALRQHPDVRDAIVIAAGEPRQLTHLIGYVIPENASAGVAKAGQAPGSMDLAEFNAEDLTGISVLDPVERIEFKLNQWGIRRDTGRETVALAPARPDGELPPDYARRRSVREFSSEALPFESLGGLLASLTQLEAAGLPKYRYPSGGSLYPVQAYVYVKPGRVQNLAAGVYYHDPREHQLLLMSAGAVLESATQLPHNRQIFERAAFAIFLIGRLAAVEPLYGPMARDFCMLEAGYMGQLLMSVAPEHEVGLCPVGAMDFASVRPLFDLDDSHFLTHLLIGGSVTDSAWESSGSGHGAARPPSAGRQHEPELVGRLRNFVAEKLPGHMRPAEYVMLDQLPLTPNGKVDRRLLPASAESGPPRTPNVPPRNDPERALLSIALRVLQVDDIGIHQNFFDVGASSIQMVQIMNEIRKIFGREVSITEIFRLPTISSLAASLAGEDAPANTLDQAAERAARRRESRGGQRGRRGRADSAEGRGAES